MRLQRSDNPVHMGDPIGAAGNLIHNVIVWFQTLAPGGFGLLIIPLGVFALMSLWFAFHHR
jgi:hypothetical protein